MNNRYLLALIVASSLGVTSCSRESEDHPKDEQTSSPSAAVIESVKPVRQMPKKRHPSFSAKTPQSAQAPKARKPARKPVIATEDRTDLVPTDKKTLLAIEKALEDEDLKAVRAVAKDALHASSPEVRSECVDMLGWFDEKTLAELTPFLSDPDKDVAENALSTWTRALGEIVDEKIRCEAVEGVMMVLKDADSLESLMMEVNDCDETLQMRTVVALIGSDNDAAAKVARDHYEFMTGDEFTTVEDAEKWLLENKSEEEN